MLRLGGSAASAGDPERPHGHLGRRDQSGCPHLSPDRFEQREHADDVQDARQILGKDAQRYLGGNLGRRLRQDVSCAHAHLHGAERVLGGLPPRAHSAGICVESLLHLWGAEWPSRGFAVDNRGPGPSATTGTGRRGRVVRFLVWALAMLAQLASTSDSPAICQRQRGAGFFAPHRRMGRMSEEVG
jgi:hypothetical protein